MRSSTRLVPISAALTVLCAVAAILLPWTHNAECRINDFLWQVPTRRHPAVITVASAVMSVLLMAALGVLTLTRTPVPRDVAASLGVAALAAAIVGALTLPLSTCFWDDSLGGGASEATWSAGPVLLMVAGLLSLGPAVLPRLLAARHDRDRSAAGS